VNLERYVNNILEPFFQTLTEEEKQHAYFQQNNATAHTSQHFMEALCEIFGERIKSQGLWPPHSPDLSVCDFYLWEKLKQNVYRNNPHTLEALENEIRSVIHDITEGELQRVSQNFLHQCQACFDADGHHFEHFL
jgi:hypothetical protein